MNFSDETMEKVAKGLAIEAYHTFGLETMHNSTDKDHADKEWTHYISQAQAALSSLTLADLMQLDEVRELVEAGNDALDNFGTLSVSRPKKLAAYVKLRDKIKPFTEPKQ